MCTLAWLLTRGARRSPQATIFITDAFSNVLIPPVTARSARRQRARARWCSSAHGQPADVRFCTRPPAAAVCKARDMRRCVGGAGRLASCELGCACGRCLVCVFFNPPCWLRRGPARPRRAAAQRQEGMGGGGSGVGRLIASCNPAMQNLGCHCGWAAGGSAASARPRRPQ